jgi:hypothetical protein
MGKYDRLGDHLSSCEEHRVHLAFSELERVLGFALPPSASRHRAWWANEREGSHSHARSWLNNGWRVDYVDLNAKQVVFIRAGSAAGQRGEPNDVRAPLSEPRELGGQYAQAQQKTDIAIQHKDGAGDIDAEPSFDYRFHLTGQWNDFPCSFPEVPRQLPRGPAIYCWCVDDAPIYVGEAEELRRRIQHYRTPGPSQTTNLRLKELLEERQSEGCCVSLRVLTDIMLNDVAMDDLLKAKAVRQFIEAWIVLQLLLEGCKLENR